ncbi:ABC transporter ATP-binding protein [Aureibacillus halotolerans]|uniref:Iron(III) transport system ATP-binding protein n=1 Tax=Aureibacillus halotolerans TaxID=1508390 RepID=A0A4R6TX48_9BACI|nr:ABC transporter ATP-binding protein [Aureibacillus halotolerans]TDQ33782.1 iron(III) transport system ATP-binding protein [Aureibacillus halotolerans]
MITFNDVTVTFDDFTAVKQLNLEINEGEFFTFLGPSGCGKTTTLRTLVGFIQPASGSISLHGTDITALPTEKRGINMVFQSYALFPTMTVYENIAFGPTVSKRPKADIHRDVLDIAAKVDLKETQLEKKVSELSGGQQQRVAIARALVNKPNILVLDEPLSNLDAKLRVQLRAELKRLQKQVGITTIYVTHDQEEALTLSDRIAVFNEGNVEQVGTPAEIYEASATPFVCRFIGDNNHLTPLVQSDYESFAHVSLPEGHDFFIRVEKLSVRARDVSTPFDENEVRLEGELVDTEYYGLYTKCTVRVGEHDLRAVQINHEQLNALKHQPVHVVFDRRDVLQYPLEKVAVT